MLTLCLAVWLTAASASSSSHAGRQMPLSGQGIGVSFAADALAQAGRQLLASHRYKLHDPVPLYANKIGPFQVHCICRLLPRVDHICACACG